MSTSLYWSPPPREVKEHCINDIKHEVARYLDPSWNGLGDSWQAGSELIPFLKGMRAAGNEDTRKAAQSLIDAIEKYGEVTLTIH